MQLNPMHLTISNLLATRLFRIPEYQRAYAWGTRQREDLFNDILEVKRSGQEHFMATVVALGRDKRSIGAQEFTAVDIVDGQQRITTLIILLKAIEKKLDASDKFESKTKRDIAELLVKSDDLSLVLLQTNHDSSNVFLDYIRSGSIKEREACTAADHNVINAIVESESFVQIWTEKVSLIDLVSIITNKLSLIYHQIPDEATVYRVFEVLNSRGLDVKWIDKLKSQLMALLFEHVSDVGSRTEHIIEMQNHWKDIYRILGIKDDLGSEALRFAGTWKLPEQPNRILGQESATTNLLRSAGTEVKSIIGIGAYLKDIVGAVRALSDTVRWNAVTKILHARFVAAAILLRGFDSSTSNRLLSSWEKSTFRIFGLGRADSRNKVGDYVRLGFRIYREDLSADQIDSELINLGADWDIDSVIKKHGWSQCYDGWGEELRYILFRYEEYLASARGVTLTSALWNSIWLEEPARSIEHISPQSEATTYKNQLGNLILLPPGVNSSLSNKKPVQKTEKYRSLGLLGAADVAHIINTQGTWDETTVARRTAQLENFIRREWG